MLDGWPPLAWVAECRAGEGSVAVWHGARVEVRDDWFAEATWDGDFAAGDFDRTDAIFGSGGRLRSEGICFVGSASTVDRLHALPFDAGVRVSNTLPGLLQVSGASLDPADGSFYARLGSVVQGLDDYERFLPTSLGALELRYCADFCWDGQRLARRDKPQPQRDFARFEAYRAFLVETTARLARNLADPARAHRYEMIGTLSRGYDSPTVAVIAREAGLERVFCFDRARDGGDDRGVEIAERLGLEISVIERDAWRRQPLAEVPYLAADAKGEDVAFEAAAGLLAGRALLSGFHGGRAWAKRQVDPRPLARGDRSGLSLCETRLWHGFLHLPLPYLGARQSGDLAALGASTAMRPWDVPGDYSRPICRRIVEEAGVPREAFGTKKQATSTLFRAGREPFAEASERDFEAWLRERGAAWWRRGRLRPRQLGPPETFEPLRRAALAALRLGARGPLWGAGQRASEVAVDLGRGYRFAFPWAVDRAMRRYLQSGR